MVGPEIQILFVLAIGFICGLCLGFILDPYLGVAGEKCLGLLEALGKVETSGGIHYTWKKFNDD